VTTRARAQEQCNDDPAAPSIHQQSTSPMKQPFSLRALSGDWAQTLRASTAAT
jgi:hypothetical protein